MNRAERRSLGISKQTADGVDRLNEPCTISEAVQISRGVAEDVLSDYRRASANLQIALSLQVEILRALCIEAGIFTEEKFKELYEKRVEEFNNMQSSMLGREENPKMECKPSDVEVRVE